MSPIAILRAPPAASVVENDVYTRLTVTPGAGVNSNVMFCVVCCGHRMSAAVCA